MTNVSVWRRLREDPLGAVRRAWQKMIVGPIRYGTHGGYDARRYWRDRLTRYGSEIRGSGHEGLSAADNAAVYAKAAKQLAALLESAGVVLERKSVLEIGCGAGVWAGYCSEAGVAGYVGVDITDVLFPILRSRHPTFEFRLGDITDTPPAGTFDVVLVLDVLEHIVHPVELRHALANLERAVPVGGVIIAAMPFGRDNQKALFHLRRWSEATVVSGFRRCEIIARWPWRDGAALALRRLPERT